MLTQGSPFKAVVNADTASVDRTVAVSVQVYNFPCSRIFQSEVRSSLAGYFRYSEFTVGDTC